MQVTKADYSQWPLPPAATRLESLNLERKRIVTARQQGRMLQAKWAELIDWLTEEIEREPRGASQ